MYISMNAATERILLKLGGMGSSRGLVAIGIVRTKGRDFHLLADRQAMRWRGQSRDIRLIP